MKPKSKSKKGSLWCEAPLKIGGTIMKKMIALILSVVLLFSLTACGSGTDEANSRTQLEGDSGKTASTVEPPVVSSPAKEKDEIYSLPETTIVDDENCTFIIKGIKETAYSVEVSAFCENKTDALLMFALDNVVVNGYMNDPFWATEVAAGKKENATIEFYKETSSISLDQIDELRFDLYVYDSENWDAPRMIEDSFVLYPTGLSADTFVRQERETHDGEVVISDDENGTFIICSADPDNDFGYTLKVFIENKTDKTMMVSWDDVSVNGYMADPFWGCSVASHSCTLTEINFLTQLKDNGIEDVEEIEFRLRMSDYDSMGDLVYVNDVFSYMP